MALPHIISASQFRSVATLNRIFSVARKLERASQQGKLPALLEGKILASLFYEVSTRTRFSFEAAMMKLGGDVITTENAAVSSSVAKGETLEDTIRIVGSYADVIVLRHPEKGSAQAATRVAGVPIINAGDGNGEHPTQALLDLYTIQQELGTLKNLTLGFVGDLLFGRTIHSLLGFMGLYPGCRVYLVSPPELRVPAEYLATLTAHHVPFFETPDLQSVASQVDVLYVTRIQKERFALPSAYEKVKDAYVISGPVVRKLKRRAIIMHPLPRVHEIAPEVDADFRAVYFKQARNGLYVRMALLSMLFGKRPAPWRQLFT